MRSVLITGARGTVGSNLVDVFRGMGWEVYAHYRDRASLSSMHRHHDEFASATPVFADFLRDHATWDLPEVVDVLVNCAGIPSRGVSFLNVTEEDLEDVLRVNLRVPVLLVRRYLPEMISRRWGRIININSIWGIRGTDESSPYVIAKHGLTGLTRSVAKEVAGSGVTINDVCPGAIESDMMDRLIEGAAERVGREVGAIEREWKLAQPGKRFIASSEVSAAVSFLASESASGVNGQSLVVDLGRIC